jgi:hypothetical protein
MRDFIERVERIEHSMLVMMRDTAERHMAEGKSILDTAGRTTEQRYVVYQCELIRRGKE